MTKIGKYEYDFVGNFSEGKAWVEKDGKEFYIDHNGKRIKEAEEDERR